MTTIPLEHIALSYDLSKAIYDRQTSINDALEIVRQNGMNEGSARIYFQVYQHLVDGQQFTRTVSAESFNYYLDKIYNDFGADKLTIALTALRNHIDYFEEVQNTRMGKVRQIYDNFQNILSNAANLDTIIDEQEENTFPEGKELYLLHRSKERNKHLIKLAKQRHLQKDDKLSCQVCSFSFVQHYGEIGHGFIEAHHIYPISELTEETITRVEDIALVCSNCHRMLHRQRPWITLDKLFEMRNSKN